MSNRTRLIVGTAIGLLLLALVLVRVDLREMLQTLAAADYLYLFPALIAQMVFFVIKAIRWRYLFPSQRRIPFGTLFSVTLIGYFGNQIVGASTGELLRSIVLGQKGSWSKSATLGTIFVEKLWDILVLCALLFGILWTIPLPSLVQTVGQAGVLVLVFGGLVVVLLLSRSESATNLVSAIANKLSQGLARRLAGIMERFTAGVQAMREWKRSLLALVLTVPMWLSLVVSFYFLGVAALIPLGPLPYVFSVVVIALAASIPNPPWNVGMLEILSITTLAVFGVSSSQALAFVVLMRAMRLVPIIWGYLLFSREGYGLRTQPQASPELEQRH
ncbi:MAG TPA: flippase-like domain-containing protein [Chloroflexi bacterium]|nr:flippase-like domain-containing protein [Chloroflexota bacterium]